MNISLFSITSGDVSFENSLTDSSLDFGFLLNSHSRYADAETMYSPNLLPECAGIQTTGIY